MVYNLSIFPVYKQIWNHRSLKTIRLLARELALNLPLVCSWEVYVLSLSVGTVIYSQRDMSLDKWEKDALWENI